MLTLSTLAIGAAMGWLALPLFLLLARRASNPMPDAREKTLLFALGAAAFLVFVPFLPARQVPAVLSDVATPLVGRDGYSKSVPDGAVSPLAALGAAYLIFALARAGRRFGAWVLLQSRLSSSLPLPNHVSTIRDHLCRDLGIEPPEVIVSDTAALPFVTGALRQRVVLPRELVDALNESELTLVLRHELIHVARRDGLNALLAELFALPFPLHPSLGRALNDIIVARESAVDLRASAPDLQQYAKLLVHVAERHQYGPAVASAVAMGKHALSRRLDVLLEKHPRGRDGISRALLATAVITFAFCAALVPHVSAAAMTFTDGTVIRLKIGEQQALNFGVVSRVAIGDPGIADVKVKDHDKNLYVTGASEGKTTLLVWSRDGTRLSFLIDVH